MTMLRIRDLGVRFGGVVALQGVSLDLNRGEILGLIGPNGAGKTTLFNCISGVIAPNEGTIHFEGRSLRFAPPHERARRGIARTFQNLQLWGSMTVLENLELPIDAIARRNTLSDALGLPFSHYAERAASERARAIMHALDLGRHAHRLAADLPAGRSWSCSTSPPPASTPAKRSTSRSCCTRSASDFGCRCCSSTTT